LSEIVFFLKDNSTSTKHKKPRTANSYDDQPVNFSDYHPSPNDEMHDEAASHIVSHCKWLEALFGSGSNEQAAVQNAWDIVERHVKGLFQFSMVS
jgi:hypothetical protein